MDRIFIQKCSIYRKHETPIERRIEERNFRGDGRGSNDIRPTGNYRERNDRIERGGERVEPRGRQMSPAQRVERDRFDRKPHPDVEFRRDRRENVNPPEWRGRDRPQGKTA